jgi:hypothetical protein
MTAGQSAALFRDPLPAGFSRHVLRFEPGREVDLEPDRVPDAIVVVEQGELEIECQKGARRRFGCGAMIPLARLPVAHLRSVGASPLVLVAVSRASDEFLRVAGSYCDR